MRRHLGWLKSAFAIYWKIVSGHLKGTVKEVKSSKTLKKKEQHYNWRLD